MTEPRTDKALERLAAALERIEAAKLPSADAGAGAGAGAGLANASDARPQGGSEQVMALINSHEKLREEVAETLRELDSMIEEHGT